jgi:CheY-like chemotaxis protein
VSAVVLGQRLRESILVTDDDPGSCQLFAEVLEGEGYEVDRAQSGEETVRRCYQTERVLGW